jgi:hypothetical protein
VRPHHLGGGTRPVEAVLGVCAAPHLRRDFPTSALGLAHKCAGTSDLCVASLRRQCCLHSERGPIRSEWLPQSGWLPS